MPRDAGDRYTAAMDKVLTVVADPACGELDEAAARLVHVALTDAGATAAAPVWLAPKAALDVAFSGPSIGEAEAAVRRVIEDAPLDVLCQALGGRQKNVLVADMDSTILTAETLDEIAAVAGIRDRIAPITARAMNGEIAFADALRERVAMLAELSADALAEVYAKVEVMAGAAAMVRTMRANGAVTALVSGGFDYFTERVRDALGFDLERSNRLEIVDGRLSGRVIEPVLDKDAKLRTLNEVCAAHGLGLADAATVGDGANDLPMLLAAGLGIAFRAKPSVARAAAFRVDHGDLTALLYAQGYSADEIVT